MFRKWTKEVVVVKSEANEHEINWFLKDKDLFFYKDEVGTDVLRDLKGEYEHDLNQEEKDELVAAAAEAISNEKARILKKALSK